MTEKLIILDVPGLPHWASEQLRHLGLHTADPEEMTLKLLEWEGWKDIDPEKSLLVFPGNGASIVRGYILDGVLMSWRHHTVEAKRYWTPGSHPTVEVESLPARVLQAASDIVVIDDVVSSGTTARKLYKQSCQANQRANWHMLTWVVQRQLTRLKGYQTLYSSVQWGTPTTREPINSLSTLLRCTDIALSFSERNLGEHSSSFLQLLADIRECL